MSDFTVDVPHTLGAAEARRRLERGTDRLVAALPGNARATPRWTGDRLDLAISALGQDAAARLDVEDRLVRVSVTLPPALAFLRPLLEQGLRRAGTELLEDRR